MKTSTHLKKVYHLLKDPARWTKHYLALDAERRPVNECSKEAVCWCLLGAAGRFAHSRALDATLSTLAEALPAGEELLAHFNDHVSHADVLSLIRRAYRVARRAEAGVNK